MSGTDTHQTALARLTAPEVVASAAFKRREWQASDKGSHDYIVRFGRRLCQTLQARGLPFFPIEWIRDAARQNQLKKEGRSLASFGSSPHNFGMAVDIVHFGKYWDCTPKEWAVIGLIGKEVARKLEIKVTWGGDWSFYDPAHWELTDWRSLRGNLQGETFGEAFARARKDGLSVFEWRGNKYTTELA